MVCGILLIVLVALIPTIAGAETAATAPASDPLRHEAHTLLRGALHSPDLASRWAALRAARVLGDKEVAEAARTLALEGDGYERTLALEVISNADVGKSTELYLAALSSPFRSVRLRGLRALAADRRNIDPFVTTVTDDEDPELRAFAARTLGECERTPAVTAALLRAAADRVHLVQEEAFGALARLGEPSLAGLLRARLNGASTEERLHVVRMMALVPDPTLLTDLGPLLADPDADVRAFAAAAVLTLTSREAP
jgi:HEAT repeat protein